MKVLIVDDTASVRLILARFMEKLGYQSVLCSDGKEAWDRLRREEFDVAIVDWIMPEMDGLTLCREIRAANFEHYIYILLCTSKHEYADLLEGMQSGADDFVVKPPRFAEFAVRLRGAERICALQRKLREQNRELKENNQELERAYHDMERDLRVAGQSLERLLPTRCLDREPISTRFLFRPSRYLGGDFLNFFPLTDETIALYVFDVSGHGIPAALKAVTLSRMLTAPGELLLNSRRRPRSPKEVARRLNQLFLDDDDYFTLIYGVFHTGSLEFQFVQAGHPAPLVVGSDGATYVGNGGFPVSLFEEAEFEEHTLKLNPKDRLYLYSDGLTELYSQNKPYGPERFRNQVLKLRSGTLQESLEAVQEDLRAWCQDEWMDDFTLLGIEV